MRYSEIFMSVWYIGALNDEVLRNLHERLVYLRNLEEKKESVLASIEEQGSLTEELREKILAAETLVVERLVYLRNLEEKKESVLASIEEQGSLTEELREKILAAETLVVVEDLYRPYRPKRKTRASVAKEKGLGGLAELILAQELSGSLEEEAAKYISEEKILAAETLVVVEDLYRPYRPKRKTRASVAKEKGLGGLAELILAQELSGSLEEEAAKYISEEKGVADVKEALQGAKDIIAESISDEADHRIYIRKLTMEEGKLSSTAKDEKAQSVYETYYQYEEPLPSEEKNTCERCKGKGAGRSGGAYPGAGAVRRSGRGSGKIYQ